MGKQIVQTVFLLKKRRLRPRKKIVVRFLDNHELERLDNRFGELETRREKLQRRLEGAPKWYRWMLSWRVAHIRRHMGYVKRKMRLSTLAQLSKSLTHPERVTRQADDGIFSYVEIKDGRDLLKTLSSATVVSLSFHEQAEPAKEHDWRPCG